MASARVPYNPYTSSLVRAIRGPVMMITVGILAALDHFGPYSFSQTWPTVIIVFGILKLGERIGAKTDAPFQTQYPGGSGL